MADHNDSAAAIGHLGDGVHDSHALAVVKAACRLIEEHDIGLHDDDGGKGDDLALATGERERRLLLGKAEALDHAECPPLCFLLINPLELEAKGHLVQDRILAELVVGVLEECCAVGCDAACRNLLRREAGDPDLARGGLEKAVQELRERRLAGTVLADDGDHLARIDAHLEVFHGSAAVGILEADVAELDNWLCPFCMGPGCHDVLRALAEGSLGRSSSGSLRDEALHDGSSLLHGEAGLALRKQAILCEAVVDAGDTGRVDADGAELLGMGKDLAGRPVEQELALIHHEDAVAVLGEKGYLLLDHDDRDTLAAHFFERIEDKGRGGRVEGGCRLVEHKDAGV